MSDINDFEIEDGVLKKYVGPGGDVIVPEEVTEIGRNAFLFCDDLKSVVLPEGVISIGDSAFSHCCKLKNVTLPDSLNSIEASAFSGCEHLRNLHFNWDAVSLGYNPFHGCKGLADEEGFIVFHGELFGYCGKKQEVVIPDGITRIRERAFQECNSIVEIILPDTVTEIGINAFSKCANLKSVHLNNGLLQIGWYAFSNCPILENITIPDSVTGLGQGAFSGCEQLNSMILPDGITDVEGYLFKNCYNLKKIVLPKSLVSIDAQAFDGCNSLKSVVIPKSVSSIHREAFSEFLEEIIFCGNQVTITGAMFKHYPVLQSIVAPAIPISEFIRYKLGMQAAQGYVDYKEQYTDSKIAEGYEKYISRQKLQLKPRHSETADMDDISENQTTDKKKRQTSKDKLAEFKRLYTAACSDGEARINYPYVSSDYSVQDYKISDNSDFNAARAAISKIDNYADAALSSWDESIKRSGPTRFFPHELYEKHYSIAFAIAIAIKIFICPDVRVALSFDSSKWTNKIECHWVLSPIEPEGRVLSNAAYSAYKKKENEIKK